MKQKSRNDFFNSRFYSPHFAFFLSNKLGDGGKVRIMNKCFMAIYFLAIFHSFGHAYSAF